jgi:glycosyltransferase involved in cell wall biosynthesis
MLLIFSDDWGRHPSSCQHLTKCLLPKHRVTWVNTIGMRSPRLNLATLRRAGERLGQWLQPQTKQAEAANVPHNPQVVSPRMWPWFTRVHDRWLNQKLLTSALKPLVQQANEPVIAITTIPVIADLMGTLPVERWLYYCVDDFSTWPGLDQRTMERMERDVIARCDGIVAASEILQQRIAQQGRTSELLTHGVDLSCWQATADMPSPAALHGLARPLVVFWGVIDPRLNIEWVQHLSRELTTGTILLVGPHDDPPALLQTLPNVKTMPAWPFAELPALGQAASVLIMPYADLPVTRAMQPLKLKEYMATGKPVVVSDLPATRSWSDCVDVATNAEMFATSVLNRIEHGISPQQHQQRQRLLAESWETKAEQFEQWIFTPLVNDHRNPAESLP